MTLKTYTVIPYIYIMCTALCLFLSCREDYEIFIPEQKETGDGPQPIDSIYGFYLLNEGNMGSNKSTLDYYDYSTSTYMRNIYGYANPDVPKEMGDVGNDIAIYGSRLYAVINCSNKVEVMDKWTCRRIGQINVPNCRYIRFDGPYAYLTSYAGPVRIDPCYEQTGYVAKIDTATMQVVDTCLVGFQPDELEIVDGKIYVANSGGYMVPNYERTVSVIDLATFREVKRIDVDINLHHLRSDSHHQLWVSSRGDYYANPSRLYSVDTRTDCVTDTIDIAVSNYCLDGDSLYVYGTEWSYIHMDWDITYGIVDVKTHEVKTRNFITDGTEQSIRMPYGIKVNPHTKDIYVTDAKNYVSPGTLYCFDKAGKCRWSVRTGDIPAHIVFLSERQRRLDDANDEHGNNK